MKEELELVQRRLLTVLTKSKVPLTGRRAAIAAGVSPTTAMRALRDLEKQQLVTSMAKGRATLWRSAPAAVDVLADGAPRAVKRRALILTALSLEMAAMKDELPEGRPAIGVPFASRARNELA